MLAGAGQVRTGRETFSRGRGTRRSRPARKPSGSVVKSPGWPADGATQTNTRGRKWRRRQSEVGLLGAAGICTDLFQLANFVI